MDTLYVSPTGNDANPGTKARPLATVGRALALKGKQVSLRGGFYSLTEPLVLGKAHSGLELVAEKSEVPVLSGGVKVSGWKEIALGRWQVRWETPVEQLYVGSERRYRPTLPKSGYYTAAGDTAPGERGYQALVHKPGDVNPGWSSLTEIEVECYQI